MTDEMIDDAEIQTQQMVPAEQPKALAKPMHRPVLTRESIRVETEQRKLLGEFITNNMVEGIDGDYGVIPGTTKRTLLKPGAEKLIQLFYCAPRYTITNKVESYERGLFSYHFKCEVLNNDGHVVAEGVGFASTYESKYRWSIKSRVCPKCGKDTIIAGKEEYGGGWLCWAKKGGCNAKFDTNDQSIVGQETGQEQDPDIINKVNTVFKIAKKRALVDAAISLARCSDLFTQDLDDLETVPPAPRKYDDMSPEANGMKPGAKNATQVRREQKEAQKEASSRGETIMDYNKPPQQQQPPAQQQPPQQPRQYAPNKVCLECGVAAVNRSKYPPRNNPDGPKGWHCYQASGGCKKNFPYESYGEDEPAQQPPAQPQKNPYQEDFDLWTEWAAKVASDDQFNSGFLKSSEDLRSYDEPRRKAIWAHVKELAKRRGLVYDMDSNLFVPKS